MGSLHYDAASTLGAGRARYFAHYGFGDGGYDAKWVALNQIGPIPIGFPNSASRVRAVRLHDLHHVLTGYDADYTGEAEISAWELGAGCGHHYAAWIINLGALMYGVPLAPRKVLHAFARGRRTRTLYGGEYDEAMLAQNLGALRAELGLDRPISAGALDVLLLAALWALGLSLFFGPLIAIATLIARVL